jgi:hypothetical protein
MTAAAIDNQIEIFGGVDTHHDTHTAAAIDAAGAMLGTKQFPATAAGYTALLAWLTSLGSAGPGRDRGHQQLRGRASHRPAGGRRLRG